MKKTALTLSSALGVSGPQIISAYGAGGKTTVLNRLAAELSAAGEKVILTTTTKIYPPHNIPLVLESAPARAVAALRRQLRQADIAALGRQLLPDGKLQGVDPAWMETILQETGASLLVEADGAAGKPVKGFSPDEPVLPAASNLIIAVTGLDAVGARLTVDEVHRPELLAGSAQAPGGAPLTTAHLAAHLRFMIQLGREQATRARVVLLLNKTDLITGVSKLVADFAARLSGLEATQLLFTNAAEPAPVHFSFRAEEGFFRPPVAGVILAAGSAARMGAEKLALDFQGRAILEHTLEQVSAAGLSQVVVVTRPGSPWRQLFAGMNRCSVIENPGYASGIAGSLKAGLAAIDGAAQGVLFALGDQPLIPAEAYRLLAEAHRRTLPLITMPVYKSARGNPLLFDRRTWPLLMKLKGDTGGRQIIPRLPECEVSRVELPFAQILLDVDTPEDYRNLLNNS